MSDQIFRTTPLPNTRSCLYTLSIRAGLGLAELVSYTFPVSPQQIRKDRRALSNVYDTQGPALAQGVTRSVDTYGLTPPMFTIEGTTGWQQHSADGMSLTGLESVQSLQSLLSQYAALTQAQNTIANYAGQAGAAIDGAIGDAFGSANGAAIGSSLAQQAAQVSLEFYDYFSDEYWVVEPVGPQTIRQSADRPLFTYYRFQWAAVRAVGSAIFGAVDALANILDVTEGTNLSGVTNSLGQGLSLYGLNGRSY